jgi:hypothetical protein
MEEDKEGAALGGPAGEKHYPSYKRSYKEYITSWHIDVFA